MKKKQLFLLCIFLLVSGFNNAMYAKKTKIASDDTIIENTILLSTQESMNYIETCYSIFSKEMDAQSGFLAWKDMRDYFNLGEESFKNRSYRTWNSIYASDSLKKIIYNNVKIAYISLGKNHNRIKINLDNTNKAIGIYPLKILLGIGVFMIEELSEILLTTILSFILINIIVSSFVRYKFMFGIWKKWSKKRKNTVAKKIKRIKSFSAFISFLVFFLLPIVFSNIENTAIKEKIKNTFKTEVKIQIHNNF